MKTLALTVALALTALPVAAQNASDMSQSERDALRAEIRAYLLENPEVLMEAIQVLETRQAAAQESADKDLVAGLSDALVNDGYSYVGGNPDGDITIVEFLDYRCGFCRRAHPEVAELIESDGNIRIITKELPILGDASVVSSRFAISTLRNAGPDAYEAVGNALIAMRTEPTADILRELGETLDIDADAILAGMGAPEIDDMLAENRRLAEQLRISGTPTFVFGDQIVRGYVPLDGMRGIVEELRTEG